MRHLHSPRRAGFTLTELMVALTIIAIALGIGMAMLGRTDKGMGLRAGTGQVMAAVRFARSAAITERSPSYVVIDAEDRTISFISKKTMGLWHLEDDVTTGALGRNGAPNGGRRIPGRIGQAWHFPGSGAIDCGPIAPFAPEQGLVLECWALVDERSEQSLVSKGDDYGIRVTKQGYLEAWVGDEIITTAPDKVPLKKWFYVEAILTTALPPPLPEPEPAEVMDDGKGKDDKGGKDGKDAKDAKDDGKKVEAKGAKFEDGKAPAAPAAERVRTFVLYVNDQLIASTEISGSVMAYLPRSSAKLTLSSSDAPMRGALDEVRVSALVEGERYRLPEKVEFDSPSQTLRFDGTGKLGGPAEIRLKSGVDTESIRVGVLGNME